MLVAVVADLVKLCDSFGALTKTPLLSKRSA